MKQTWHEVAASEGYFCCTGWAAEDVLELKPGWTKDQAESFLRGFGSKIVDRMVEAGWVALEHAVDWYGEDCEEIWEEENDKNQRVRPMENC